MDYFPQRESTLTKIRFTRQSFQNFGNYHRLCLSRQEATQIFLISNGIAMAESSVVEEVAVLFHAALIGRSDVIKVVVHFVGFNIR